MSTIRRGEYVLATKYSDGDPLDQWSVGFLKCRMMSYLPHFRYDIVDSEGKSFRGNGFRRAERISPEVGRWMVEHVQTIESSGRSLWWWKRALKDEASRGA